MSVNGTNTLAMWTLCNFCFLAYEQWKSSFVPSVEVLLTFSGVKSNTESGWGWGLMAGSINESRFDVRTAENHKESVGCHYSLYLIKGLVFIINPVVWNIWLRNTLAFYYHFISETLRLPNTSDCEHQLKNITKSFPACLWDAAHPSSSARFPSTLPSNESRNQPPKNPVLFFQNKSMAWFCFTFFITMALFSFSHGLWAN